MTIVADTYTGHVESQTSARRTLPGVTIIKTSVGPMDNNTYLVTCSETGESLLIDAANDPELLVRLLAEHAPKVELIVTTHQHGDHWQALEAVAEAFEELLGDVSSQLFGVYGDNTVVYPGHGDDTTLGEERPHLEEWRERGW